MEQSIAILIMLGMMPWAGLNAQQTARTTLSVTARMEESCKVTAPDFVLGNRTTRGGALLPAKIQLSVTCTPDTTYNVDLNKGTSRGATISERKTATAGAAVPGNTTDTDRVTGVGTGREVDHTLFGEVLATQLIPAGDYTDTITERVNY